MSDTSCFPTRIISGGQTGVDRAALDAALQLNIPHGGWCPRGRRAEDGRIPQRYLLQETESRDYAARTLQNVLDADGTLLLTRGPLRGGTLLTAQLAGQHNKPQCTVNLSDADGAQQLADAQRWLAQHRIQTLNVAGPRESQSPGIHQQAIAFLLSLLSAPDDSAAGDGSERC